MANGFDIKELEEYEKKLISLASTKMPNECKKFMRVEGNKLKRVTLANAKAAIKKKSGNYFKSIKRGKAYKYQGNDAWAVRVYSYDPKAHLLEKGHRIVTRGKGKKAKKHYTTLNGGIEKGFAKGYKVFKKSEQEFQNTFYNDVENFIDEVIEKGLK